MLTIKVVLNGSGADCICVVFKLRCCVCVCSQGRVAYVDYAKKWS